MLRLLAGTAGGLAYWIAMMLPAIILAGPGGGPPTWPAPFVVSVPGLLLFPVTGFLLSIPHTADITVRTRKAWAARITLWFVFGLDATLLANVALHLLRDLRQYGLEFLAVVLLFGLPWLTLWALWHYVVICMATERTLRL